MQSQSITFFNLIVSLLFLVSYSNSQTVELTYVPKYGDDKAPNLQGIVKGADPSKHYVTVYLFVDAWYTKPNFSKAKTKIYANGTFSVNIHISQWDKFAYRVAVILFPNTVNVTKVLVDGLGHFPLSFQQMMLAYATAQRGTIHWANLD